MEVNLPREWGTGTMLLISGTVEYKQNLIRQLKKEKQEMSHQKYITTKNADTPNIIGIQILYTNQSTISRGGQICPNTTEDGIFSTPLLSLALN